MAEAADDTRRRPGEVVVAAHREGKEENAEAQAERWMTITMIDRGKIQHYCITFVPH